MIKKTSKKDNKNAGPKLERLENYKLKLSNKQQKSGPNKGN